MSGETDETPLEASWAPLSHTDFHPTVIDAIGGDGFAYEAGLPAFAVDEEEFRLRTYIDSNDGVLDTYVIDGEVSDIARWYLKEKAVAQHPFYR